MKRTILVLALLFAGNLYAQYDDDYTRNDSKDLPEGIKKGDNLILISTDRDASTNFIEFGRHLVSHGYTFSTKDTDFMVLVTDEKKPDGGYWYILNITFQDNQIIVRGKQSGLAFGSTIAHPNLIWGDWKYASSNANYYKISFNDFYPVLIKYGYPVSFSKE